MFSQTAYPRKVLDTKFTFKSDIFMKCFLMFPERSNTAKSFTSYFTLIITLIPVNTFNMDLQSV